MASRADTSLKNLERLGLLSPEQASALGAVAARYAVAITPASAALIDTADPRDPIGLQFLPDPRELESAPPDRSDPIGDERHATVPGIVHRYADRVLLIPTLVCASYCRFCFRREKVGGEEAGLLNEEHLSGAFDYIRSHPEIWEVILTGGDPLVLSPRRLETIFGALDAIDHVKVVRVHTRVPSVAPERVTEDLVRVLRRPKKAVFVALHANHPRELTENARAACARIIDAGVPMISQTVLLKGINDDVETLGALMRAFVENRIKPYYLHQTDFARGTGHFRVDLARAQALAGQLRGPISGLCQPTLILDIPGGAGKVPVGPSYVTSGENGLHRIEDPSGGAHFYPPES